MVGSIVVVGALTSCALLHSVYDLKAVQTLMLHELGLNAAKTTKNICCAKDAIDHSMLTRCSKKFCSDCKNLDNQTISSTMC